MCIVSISNCGEKVTKPTNQRIGSSDITAARTDLLPRGGDETAFNTG